MRLSTTMSVYIGRQFIVTFFAVFMILLALVLLVDMIELLRRAASKPGIPGLPGNPMADPAPATTGPRWCGSAG